jgi:predicted PhzF superfamily epimerase YddE/YHI9
VSPKNSWQGVDLDGTLAHYTGFNGPLVIGPPIAAMVEKVRSLLASRVRVKIFTARIAGELPGSPVVAAVKSWARTNLDADLDVTNVKDYGMVRLWDDRATQVIKNTGLSLADTLRARLDVRIASLAAEVQTDRVTFALYHLHAVLAELDRLDPPT